MPYILYVFILGFVNYYLYNFLRYGIMDLDSAGYDLAVIIQLIVPIPEGNNPKG